MSRGCGRDELDEELVQVSSNNAGGCDQNGNCSGSGGCQQQGSFGSWVRRQGTNSAGTNSYSTATQEAGLGTCKKCKQRPAVTTIRQQEPYCNECLEAGVQQKVRNATKNSGLIQAGDHVLLAASGGAGSIALLYCTLEMQQCSNSKHPERGKVPFKLSVVHIDSSAAQGVPAEQAVQQLQQLQAAVAAAGYAGSLLVLQLHDVFAAQGELQQQLQHQAVQQLQQQMTATHLLHNHPSEQQQQQPAAEAETVAAAAAADPGTANSSSSNGAPNSLQQCQQRQQQLLDLLLSISDTTGREDLLTYLQDHLLLRAAAALGCNRMLRGESASRQAVQIIAEAAKGRGFSLPADIQLLDARTLPAGGPCVIHPMREVTYKELVTLCAYKNIRWCDRQLGEPILQGLLAGPGSSSGSSSSGLRSRPGGHGAASVNALAEKFIADMQQAVPASMYPILRTAAHLQPFGFTNVAAVPAAARVQQLLNNKRGVGQAAAVAAGAGAENASPDGGTGSNSCTEQQLGFCAVCRAPLPVKAATSTSASDDGVPVDGAAAAAAADRLTLAGLTGKHSRQLCYSCNRQILYKVQPAAAAAAGIDGQTPSQDNLEARMERLRQLLPPGLLLDDE